MKNEGILCISGPLAGERITDPKATTPEGYRYHYSPHTDLSFFFFNFDVLDEEDAVRAMAYGYEQHCKTVAARNCTTSEPGKNLWGYPENDSGNVLDRLNRDHYTASFLRSCKTVILANPFNASPMPLTLNYGKHHLGEINDSLEFIARGESNENCGRITVIAIIP